MKPSVISSPTYIPPQNSRAGLLGLFGKRNEIEDVSVQLPDADLRRIGHLRIEGMDNVHIREEFRGIKRRILTAIEEAPPQGDPRIILVTSACPEDGKTFVALNLALSLAIDPNITVTLIDGDIVGHGLSSYLDLMSLPGLCDLISDRSSSADRLIQSTNIRNLKIIPSGSGDSEATELLSGNRMANLLADLRRRSADHIIIMDSGALLSGSLPIALATHAGQVLFVVASNGTRRADVDESLGILDSAIGPLEETKIGLIFNKISPSQSTARYVASS